MLFFLLKKMIKRLMDCWINIFVMIDEIYEKASKRWCQKLLVFGLGSHLLLKRAMWRQTNVNRAQQENKWSGEHEADTLIRSEWIFSLLKAFYVWAHASPRYSWSLMASADIDPQLHLVNVQRQNTGISDGLWEEIQKNKAKRLLLPLANSFVGYKFDKLCCQFHGIVVTKVY